MDGGTRKVENRRRLLVERRSTRDARCNRLSLLRRMMVSRQWKAGSNVRLLSVYLEPGLYETGVDFISEMNYYYTRRDRVRFTIYFEVFGKFVLENDVAKFRARKVVEKLYGDMISQLP